MGKHNNIIYKLRAKAWKSVKLDLKTNSNTFLTLFNLLLKKKGGVAKEMIYKAEIVVL